MRKLRFKTFGGISKDEKLADLLTKITSNRKTYFGRGDFQNIKAPLFRGGFAWGS
jgi:hypothetical protein